MVKVPDAQGSNIKRKGSVEDGAQPEPESSQAHENRLQARPISGAETPSWPWGTIAQPVRVLCISSLYTESRSGQVL